MSAVTLDEQGRPQRCASCRGMFATPTTVDECRRCRAISERMRAAATAHFERNRESSALVFSDRETYGNREYEIVEP
jgi:hypothetical protein